MEKAVKKKATKASLSAAAIMKAYKKHLLTEGIQPKSVFVFMEHLNEEEEEFYKYFSSFEAIDAELWKSFAERTIKAIKSDKAYNGYGAREKMLAFLFTLVEVLKKDRCYVKLTFKRPDKPELVPAWLRDFKKEFDAFSMEVIEEGIGSEEIVKRPILSERYHDGLWLQILFIISFWLKDTSKGFERTDAAIEKSANLSFELMGRGPLDLMLDFGKFLYQNR
ncbi:MAG: TetR family transcriptional regulator C-terminal domain-containing protein [Fulvivirga sp.]